MNTMQPLAITAEQIGYWSDKAIYIVAIAFVLAGLSFKGSRRRRAEEAQEAAELEAERAADIKRAGPPRFNG
jgi:hypothetical protein